MSTGVYGVSSEKRLLVAWMDRVHALVQRLQTLSIEPARATHKLSLSLPYTYTQQLGRAHRKAEGCCLHTTNTHTQKRTSRSSRSSVSAAVERG